MYLHLKLNKDVIKFFGFAVEDVAGRLIFYQYVVLPFGYTTATWRMAQLLKPFQYFLHFRSIDFSIYVDDSFSVHPSVISSYAAHLLVIYLFSLAGWQINFAKTSLVPAHQIYYLGFWLCTKTMTVCAPHKKLLRTNQLIEDLLALAVTNTKAKVKQVAQILGLLCHLIISHGNWVRIATRHSQNKLGHSVTLGGWHVSMVIGPDMVRELKYCQSVLFR